MAHDAEGFAGNGAADRQTVHDLGADNLALNNGQGAPGATDPGILVAQAAAPAAPSNTETVTVQADATGNVHLPDGADLGTPKVVGNDLEFIQPDGHVILIPNGAVIHLTVYVGNVEVPPATLVALLQANGIQPAEGPGGQGPGAHPNFTDATPGGIGSGIGYTDLLPPNPLSISNEFGYVRYNSPLEKFDVSDSQLDGPVSEAYLTSAGVLDPATLSGDGTHTGGGNYFIDGQLSAPYATTFSVVAASGVLQDDLGDTITSLGETISFRTPTYSIPTGETVVEGWTDPTHGDASRLVFRLVMHADGHYTFTLNDQVDDNVGNGTALNFDLSSLIQVSNGPVTETGLPPGTVTVHVLDDAPLAGQTITIEVDESGLHNGNYLVEAPGDDAAENNSSHSDISSFAGHLPLGADAPPPGGSAVSFAQMDGLAVQGFLQLTPSLEEASEGQAAGSFTTSSEATDITSQGHALHYVWDAANATLWATWASDGEAAGAGNSAFDLHITNQQTGAFTFELLSPLDDQSPNNGPLESPDYEDNIVLNLGFTLHDNDGDSASGTINITINDDSPWIEGHIGAMPTLTVDESYVAGSDNNPDPGTLGGGDAIATATASFAGIFETFSAADGYAGGSAGTGVTYALGLGTDVSDALTQNGTLRHDSATGLDALTNLSATGLTNATDVDSGVKDTQTGQEVLLNVVGGEIVGTVTVDDATYTVFTIATDAAGDVTLTQYRSVIHGDTADPNDTTGLSLGDLNHITLIASVTDGDGDTYTSALGIESAFHFQDDAPTIAITPATGGDSQGDLGTSGISLVLDESIGGDPGGSGNLYGADDDTGNTGWDPTGTNPFGETATIAQAQRENNENHGDLAALFNIAADPGADGYAGGDERAGITYAYSFALSDGETSGVGTAVETTLSVTDPKHQFDQYGSDTIYLVQTSATEIVGYVGPIHETDGGIDNAIAFRISLQNINDYENGKIFVDQYLAIDHGPDNNNLDAPAVLDFLKGGNGDSGAPTLDLNLSATITDGDGDHSTTSSSVTLLGNGAGAGGDDSSAFLTFEDDGPTLSVAVHSDIDSALFFDGFTPTNPANEWGEGSATNSTGQSGGWTITETNPDGTPDGHTPTLERVGANYDNGLLHTSNGAYMVDMDASPGDIQLSQTLNLAAGQTYTLSFEAGQDGLGSEHLEVWFGGQKIFDLNDNYAGGKGTFSPMTTYTLQLVGGSGDSQNLLEFRDVGAADNRGTYLANITVHDAIVIDETAGIQPNTDETTDSAVAALFSAVANQGTDPDMVAQYATGHGDVLDVTVTYGTDGPAASNALTYGLTLTESGVDSGLMTTDGHHIYLFDENGIIVGRYDSPTNSDDTVDSSDPAAFAVAIDPATGVLSVAQFVSLQHPDSASNNEPVSLNTGVLVATATATDGDGDSVSQSADISSLVLFKDDGPTASYSGRVTVQEADAADGSFAPQAASGHFVFDGGADGAHVTSVAYGLGQANGVNQIDDPEYASFTTLALTSGGQAISIGHGADNNPLEVVGTRADGTVVFTLEVTNAATGDYTFTQL
ncbi:MAG TPA: DUF5801 repeats-in-toxin domain-containing protein, partial [Devosia sp.]|nr:DUF5801 repeats-in-toxin domain-containing protein [Devosia sp.]